MDGTVFVVATLYQGEVSLTVVERTGEQADAGEFAALIAGVEKGVLHDFGAGEDTDMGALYLAAVEFLRGGKVGQGLFVPFGD